MPVNCAAEMRKCPPSICSSSKGNVMQKAKVGCHKTRIRAPIAISLFYQVALCLNVLHHNQNADCDKRTAWSALIGVLYVQTLNVCPVFFFLGMGVQKGDLERHCSFRWSVKCLLSWNMLELIWKRRRGEAGTPLSSTFPLPSWEPNIYCTSLSWENCDRGRQLWNCWKT